ncbi:MAG: DUF503 family protein [Anaerolineales bacterium]
MGMCVGLLSLTLFLPGCASLKEKRSRIKPLLTRLHREFNLSAAEVGLQDVWQSARVACAWVGSDAAQVQRSLQAVAEWLETHWHDAEVQEFSIQVLH